MEEKNTISSLLQDAVTKQETFRRTLHELHDRASSILLLTVQGNDLVEHFDSVRSLIKGRVEELRSMEDSVGDRLRRVETKEKELEGVRESVEGRWTEMDEREKEFRLTQEKEFEWIMASMNDLEAMREAIEKCTEERGDKVRSLEREVKERAREIEVKEKEIEKKEKECEEFLSGVRMRERKVEEMVREVEKREKGVEMKEMEVKECERILKDVEQREKGIEKKEKECEEFLSEVRVRERKVEEMAKEVETRDKRMELKEREVERSCNVRLSVIEAKEKAYEKKVEHSTKKSVELFLNEKKLKERWKELELRDRKVGERCMEVELKEKELEELKSRERKVEEMSKELEERFKVVEMKEKEVEKSCNERVTVIEAKQKGCEQLMNELKLREKKVEEHFRKKSAELLMNEMKFRELRKELELRDMKLGERYKEVELKEKQLEELKSRERKVEEMCKEMEFKEEEFKKTFGELLVNEKKVEEQCKEVEFRDRKVEERFKAVELKEKQFEEKVNEKVKEIEAKENELKLREKNVEETSINLGFKEDGTRKRFREFLVKKKKFEEQCEEKIKEIGQKEKQVEVKGKKVEWDSKNLEGRVKEFESKEKQLQLENKKLEERIKEFEAKVNQFEGKTKEFELESQKLVERAKEFELKERQLEERCKECDWKEKQFAEFSNASVKIDAIDTHVVKNTMDCNSDANLQFSVTMNGKALQMLLNEHCNEYDQKRSEVDFALRLSSDAAKLVLSAMEGFYPPHLKKGDVAFEGGVVKKSCILLLEQLMRTSPEIMPDVKKEAMRLANEWAGKMRVDGTHSLEVLGFLLLLVSYGLASAFDDDKLLSYLHIVAQHDQAPQLFRCLGFADKISGVTGFIQILIEKKQHIEAISFICAFGLVKKFPPGPLLKEYLEHSKISARKIKRRDKRLEVQIEATNKRIADLRAVLKCIKDRKIESEVSSNILMQQVNCFEKENLKRQEFLARKSRPPHLNDLYVVAAAADPALAPESASTENPVLNSPITASTAPSAAPSTPASTRVNTAPQAAPSFAASTPAMTVASSSTAAAPPSAKIPKSQPRGNKRPQQEQQGGFKRCRVAAPPKIPSRASFAEVNFVHSVRLPSQQQAGLFMPQDAPYLHAQARHYSLSGYPLTNPVLGSHYNNMSHHHWNGLGR